MAADWYVDGDCANNGDGSSSACAESAGGAGAFNDPQGCIDNMSGGDTCYIAETSTPYNHNCAGGVFPYWDFDIRGGTAGNPTTIRNLPGETPKFCKDATCSSTQVACGPIIGTIDASSYQLWQGLHIDGSMLLRGDGDKTGEWIHHIEVTDMIFEGGDKCDGNWAPFRVEDAQDMHVHHNEFRDLDYPGGCANMSSAAALKIFTTEDSVFEYNTFDVPGGDVIFLVDDKSNSTRNAHRYNDISGSGFGYRINADGTSTSGTEVYGNVISASSGLRPLYSTSGLKMYNNTIIGPGECVRWGGADTTTMSAGEFYNNICHSATENFQIDQHQWDALSDFSIDYNVYDSGGTYRADAYGADDTSHATLSAWTTDIQGQSCADCEANSREAQCSFVDAANDDYRITDGDTCKTAGQSGGEVGAYGVTDCVGKDCVETSAAAIGTTLSGVEMQ
jgi:hypothetical protein